MGIASSIYLPPLVRGTNFSAELLPKVGTRNGMKCIYKALAAGDKKRAGVYLKSDNGYAAELDIAGNLFVYKYKAYKIEYPSDTPVKYKSILEEDAFKELVIRTLTHFDVLDKSGLGKNAVATRHQLTDAEIKTIPQLGVF